MNVLGCVVAAILSFGSMIPLPVEAQRAETIASISQDRQSPLPLLSYLQELGMEHSRFFTIEEAWRDGESLNQMESHLIQRPSTKLDFDQELEQLREIVPDLTYEINQVNKRIIHIIDARLAKQRGYALERTIEGITFKGAVNDLPAAIREQGIPISSPQGMFLGGGETRDHTTVVDIRGQGLRVRDALSNYVPLNGPRRSILWVARTKLGEGEVTYLYYP